MASEVKSDCSDFSVEVSELVALGVVDELKQPQISDLVLGHEGDGLLVHLEYNSTAYRTTAPPLPH